LYFLVRLLPAAVRPLAGFLCAVSLCPASSAQNSGTGTVEGRIFNPATGEYVRNAEIRAQGTDRITYSEEGGRYSLGNVPAGTATIAVTYSGYQTATAAVTVASGSTATRDFELVSALVPAMGEETLKMGAFVVSTEREGNAKAIMEQQRNMNISTSVAADTYGELNEGNVGEFLKFLPASMSSMSMASAADLAWADLISNMSG
jgi:hypothetical protein